MQHGSYNRETFHGGDLTAAKAEFGDGSPTWIDLSTGINPRPYPIPDLTPQCWSRLPATSLEETLLCAARCYYNQPADTPIVAASGTQALIQVLPLITQPANVAVLAPTYAEHAKCWAQAGHQVIEITSLGDLPTDCSICVVVAPNNPTGKDYAPKILAPLAEDLKARGGFLVIDEAFRDVAAANSLAQTMPADAAITLKSFGKFFGLAGARLGFAIGGEALITPLKTALGPWAVSGAAMEIAIAAFADDNWIAQTRTRLSRDRARLEAALLKAGFEITGGTDLFSYVHMDKVTDVYTQLCQQHILTRPFAHDPAKLRFGHPETEDDWTRFLGAIDQLA